MIGERVGGNATGTWVAGDTDVTGRAGTRPGDVLVEDFHQVRLDRPLAAESQMRAKFSEVLVPTTLGVRYDDKEAGIGVPVAIRQDYGTARSRRHFRGAPPCQLARQPAGKPSRGQDEQVVIGSGVEHEEQDRLQRPVALRLRTTGVGKLAAPPCYHHGGWPPVAGQNHFAPIPPYQQ